MVLLPKYVFSCLTINILLLQYHTMFLLLHVIRSFRKKRFVTNEKNVRTRNPSPIRKGWSLLILVLSYQLLKEKGDILKHKKKYIMKKRPFPKINDCFIAWQYRRINNTVFPNYYSRSLLQDQAGWRVDQQLKYFWKLSLYQPLKPCVMINLGMN